MLFRSEMKYQEVFLKGMGLLLLLLAIFSGKLWSEQFSTITLKQGVLKGKNISTSTSSSYISFLGIPYAKPPIGELRFKPPVEPEPWEGTLDATKEANICMQFDQQDQKVKGDEDCLYLNVYTPDVQGLLKPVMIWIHGGGYVTGSGNEFMMSPELLVEAGVVFVSINYRLGPFGYLSTDDSAIVGNMGMKDQVQALRWVQQNIASFGGDPNKVTIFGASAGGASVQYHMLSPMSRGLFHGAIAQSGVITDPCAFAVNSRENAFLLGNALGFTGDSTQELADFLRNQHAQEILVATQDAAPKKGKKPALWLPYVPNVEPAVEGEMAFLPDYPVHILEKGEFNHVPFITGVTSVEGIAIIYSSGAFDGSKIQAKLDICFEFLGNCLQKDHDLSEKITKIRSLYLEDGPINNDTIDTLVHIMSDIIFTEGMLRSLDIMSSQNTTPVYMYYFSYDGGLGLLKKILHLESYPGVSHGDDLGYIFKYPFLETKDPLDEKVRSEVITLWTNFAKTGNPSSGVTSEDIPNWLPYSKSEANYLDIGSKLMIKKDLSQNRKELWNKLYNSPQSA